MFLGVLSAFQMLVLFNISFQVHVCVGEIRFHVFYFITTYIVNLS